MAIPKPYQPPQVKRGRGSRSRQRGGLLLLITAFLPFAAGLFLWFLFRGIHAPLVGRMSADLSMDAQQLGILTAAFFLAALLLQVPLGAAIDRYGPGRVQGWCLLIVSVGAFSFSIFESYIVLLLARALIGVGLAAALAAGLKAIVIWFPAERIALLNGVLIGIGAMGAIAASLPIEWALESMTWRDVFEYLALISAICGVLTLLIVPRVDEHRLGGDVSAAVGYGHILRDRLFWRVAPLSAVVIGSTWALQSLWAAPWLADVAGLTTADVAQELFLMACALAIGAVGFGVATDRLARRGIGPDAMLAAVAAVLVFAEIMLALKVPVLPTVMWCVVGACAGAMVLSYTIIAAAFDEDEVGRANSILNLMHMGGAFAVQVFIGWMASQWDRDAQGHYPAVAYASSLIILAILQLLALMWFLRPVARAAASAGPELKPSSPAAATVKAPVRRMSAARYVAGALGLVAVVGVGLAATGMGFTMFGGSDPVGTVHASLPPAVPAVTADKLPIEKPSLAAEKPVAVAPITAAQVAPAPRAQEVQDDLRIRLGRIEDKLNNSQAVTAAPLVTASDGSKDRDDMLARIAKIEARVATVAQTVAAKPVVPPEVLKEQSDVAARIALLEKRLTAVSELAQSKTSTPAELAKDRADILTRLAKQDERITAAAAKPAATAAPAVTQDMLKDRDEFKSQLESLNNRIAGLEATASAQARLAAAPPLPSTVTSPAQPQARSVGAAVAAMVIAPAVAAVAKTQDAMARLKPNAAAPVTGGICSGEEDPYSNLISLPFGRGDGNLPATQAKQLDGFVAIAKSCPSMTFHVIGHTDNRGSREQNAKLSKDRADQIAAYLVRRGIDARRINVSAQGSTTPAAPNAVQWGRSVNRRVEVLLTATN
jgi:outer membrane protein OmpA-like peptidoglycan-associated protein/MFS family permease